MLHPVHDGPVCVLELGGRTDDKFDACAHEWNWHTNRPRITHCVVHLKLKAPLGKLVIVYWAPSKGMSVLWTIRQLSYSSTNKIKWLVLWSLLEKRYPTKNNSFFLFFFVFVFVFCFSIFISLYLGLVGWKKNIQTWSTRPQSQPTQYHVHTTMLCKDDIINVDLP